VVLSHADSFQSKWLICGTRLNTEKLPIVLPMPPRFPLHPPKCFPPNHPYLLEEGGTQEAKKWNRIFENERLDLLGLRKPILKQGQETGEMKGGGGPSSSKAAPKPKSNKCKSGEMDGGTANVEKEATDVKPKLTKGKEAWKGKAKKTVLL
jgi:hypothetical protein